IMKCTTKEPNLSFSQRRKKEHANKIKLLHMEGFRQNPFTLILIHTHTHTHTHTQSDTILEEPCLADVEDCNEERYSHAGRVTGLGGLALAEPPVSLPQTLHQGELHVPHHVQDGLHTHTHTQITLCKYLPTHGH